MAELISSESDRIEQFINVTGSDETVAKNMLEAFNNNLEMAINMFLEGCNPKGEEIREIPSSFDDCLGGSSSASVASKSSVNKNERKRLTSSCTSTKYQPNGMSSECDEDEVRAPIPQRQEVLVEDRYHAIPYARSRRVQKSVFNSCRDFQKETEEYEGILKSGKKTVELSRKRKRLHDLFQPPYDLIHNGDFQSARDTCNSKKKWLLVNIQKCTEFSCQVLNRDVWSNKLVRDIVNTNFILWQVAYDSDEGMHYTTFYEIKDFPHLSVIDPRTGERMVVWEKFGMKPNPQEFSESLTLFLAEHSSLNDSFESDGDRRPLNVSKKSIIDLDENDQIEAALKASLHTVTNTSENEENSDTDEEDEEEDSSHSDDAQPKDTAAPESPCEDEKIIESSENEDSNHTAVCLEKEEEIVDNEDKLLHEIPDFSTYSGEKATILLRLPDNGRKQILFPLECTLKDLSLEISRLGFSEMRYEIIKTFPRQNLSLLDPKLTLKDAGLHKQETLFVQDR